MKNDKTTEINSEINVDSLKLRLPIDLVHINENSELRHKFSILNETTGEITKRLSKVPRLTIEKAGHTYEYWIATYKHNLYLYMTINAKMLGTRYFEGVTKHNIQLIYDEIISQKEVYFSYEHFMHKSWVTDVDFKRDFTADNKDYQKYMKQLKSLSPNRKDKHGYRSYENGLVWNARETQAPISHPNVKFYDKEKQMNKTKKCRDFQREYIRQDMTNLKRLEFQLKNKKHMESLGLPNTSLHTILSLSQDEKETILEKIINKVINVNEYSIIDEDEDENNKLKPQEQRDLNNLKNALLIHVNLQDAMNSMTNGLSRQRRHDYAKRLSKVYEAYIMDKAENEPQDPNYTLWKLMFKLETINAMKGKTKAKAASKPVKKQDPLQRILADYEAQQKAS